MKTTTVSIPTRQAAGHGELALFTALLLAVALATGCASSGKLAQKSGQHLAEGDVRKAWATALRAIEKDPYNTQAVGALSAAGQALLNHEARRFRGLAPMDTLAAADVSLGMDDLRRQVADHGALLVSDATLVAEEKRVRSRVCAWNVAEAEEQLAAGQPKVAYESFANARRYDDSNPKLALRMQKTHDAATDRVLVLPYAVDTRARIDTDGLSADMLAAIRRYTAEDLTFTTLAEPAATTGRGSRQARNAGSIEAAYAAAEDRSATRVAWTRIHGDRIESHSETYVDVVYYKLVRRNPDGTTRENWIEVPVLVRIEDRWVSAEVECEVHDLSDERVVARRATDHGAGLRIVNTLTPFPGAPGDYALYTPEMWAADRDGCRRKSSAWEERFGTLTVEGLVGYARKNSKATVSRATPRHGYAVRTGRNFGVSYGILPGEAALLETALTDAWKEVAAALEEADKS